jgi:hypothetical protein
MQIHPEKITGFISLSPHLAGLSQAFPDNGGQEVEGVHIVGLSYGVLFVD